MENSVSLAPPPCHLAFLYGWRGQVQVTRLARQVLLPIESSYQPYAHVSDKVVMRENMSRNYTLMNTKAVDFCKQLLSRNLEL